MLTETSSKAGATQVSTTLFMQLLLTIPVTLASIYFLARHPAAAKMP
jgi:hypothetical protein